MAKVEFRIGFGYHRCCYFPRGFCWLRTEQVFLRAHLISSTVCVGHAGSEPEQCLCEIENLALPKHFFLSSPYKQCT